MKVNRNTARSGFQLKVERRNRNCVNLQNIKSQKLFSEYFHWQQSGELILMCIFFKGRE